MTVREKWRAWFMGDKGPYSDDPNLRDLSFDQRQSCIAYLAAWTAATEAAARVALGAPLVNYGTCREFDVLSQQREACATAIRANAGDAGA